RLHAGDFSNRLSARLGAEAKWEFAVFGVNACLDGRQASVSGLPVCGGATRVRGRRGASVKTRANSGNNASGSMPTAAAIGTNRIGRSGDAPIRHIRGDARIGAIGRRAAQAANAEPEERRSLGARAARASARSDARRGWAALGTIGGVC